MTQGFPSKHPSSGSGLASALDQILTKFLQGVDDCLPASVLSYDRKTNRARVQPLVAALSTEGTTLSRAPVASLPVLVLGCGRYMVNFPLEPGNLGWIKANDRDVSLFLQGLGESPPNTLRQHSFEDGLFIPCPMQDYQIDGEDGDNLVIQTHDGDIRVAVWQDRVKVTAGPSSLVVNKDGTGTWTAPEKIFLDTPLVELAGIFKSGVSSGGGESTMNGSLRTTGDQVAGGVSAMSHTHTGVQPGSGNTGQPNGGA